MTGSKVAAGGGETRRPPFTWRSAMSRGASWMIFWPRLAAACVGFAMAVVAGAVLSLARRDRTRVASDIGGMIGSFTLPALGLRLVVAHRERLAAAQPCVYVANHQSFVDYPVLGSIFPPRTVVLGRANLRRMPLIGWLYRATGNLLVDRGDPASRRAAIEQMIAAVRAGTSVWVFPEGTRNTDVPGTLLAFRRGAFHVAAATGSPIVPVVVEPLRPRTDLRARRLTPRALRVEVLEPIQPHGLDADQMAREARRRMAAALLRIGATQE